MDTKQHWNRQAAKGELSGTQDRIAKELEMRARGHPLDLRAKKRPKGWEYKVITNGL